MSSIRIGLGQLNTRDNKAGAFREIEQLTAECAGSGAEIVVFPELSTYLSEAGTKDAAETLHGESMERFKNLARTFGIYIHNGSFVERIEGSGKVYNTSVLINPSGKIEAVYRKIHLFDMELDKSNSYRESDRFEAGSSITTADTALGHFGFSICYDLRFPELYRKLTSKGAELVFIPAAFTLQTGKDHWETLLRARAIENQVYIAAPDQIGLHPGNKVCYGNSMIVDPWGKVIARASDRVTAVVADIDLDYLTEIREKLPCLKNRISLDGMEGS